MLESIDRQLDPFLDRYLDPAGRLGEILFGLIMALGIGGAVRLGLEEADNRALLIGILGCNLAWAIVDGVMYVLTALFERGRKLRLARDVRAARNDAAALQLIAGEYDDTLEPLLTPEERAQMYRSVLSAVRRWRPEPIQLRRDDFLGGVAVALVILVATVPIVVPYLLVSNPNLAVRLSNGIALTLLFLLGAWWGRVVGARSWRIAAGLTLVGIVLVLITIALGG
jgi:VIT1/CCC1 family predicted Fe2+/Mn2+ transporter